MQIYINGCTHTLMNGNCLQLFSTIPEHSIDMIFADLPYGTTQNTWDKVIPLQDYLLLGKKQYTLPEYLLHAYKKGIAYNDAVQYFKVHKNNGLWSHYKRIIKETGCIALWAQAPFAQKLVESNSKLYRYEWIIEKTKATGHLNAKKMPMKAHENVLIFYKNLPVYNPQMTSGHAPVHSYTKHTDDGSCYGKTKSGISGGGSTNRYPRDVLKFSWDTQKSKLSRTQKPVAACEYFIKTYTNAGDTVLDHCFGSNTTGIACLNAHRNYIGMEKEEIQFTAGKERLIQMLGKEKDAA